MRIQRNVIISTGAVYFWLAVSTLTFGQGQAPPSPPTAQQAPASTPGSAAAAQPQTPDPYVLVPASEIAKLTAAASGKDKGPESKWPGFVDLVGHIAWPVIVLILALLLLKSPQIENLVSKLSRRVSQFSVAGLEFKLSEGAVATIDDIRKLISQVPETHEEWVSNSQLEDQFEKVVDDIRNYFCKANADYPIPLSANQFGKFRFTLHVPDVILTHSLRQLVNYVGNDRGKSGRIFSARRGLIGLAWRLEESQFETVSYTEDELVVKWGMTRSEAKDTSGNRPLLLTVILKNAEDLPVGMLYADSAELSFLGVTYLGTKTAEHAFSALEMKIKASCSRRGLTPSLQKLEEARRKLKQVDLYIPVRTS